MYLKFNRYSNIRENFFGRKKWQHLSCTVQWPSRFVVCSIVELSVKLKSVLTQCACKRLRINLEFFSEPSKKKGKNRDYIELAYSQLKQLVSYSWLWYFSPNLCRQFLTKVRTATASQLNVTDTALAAVANGSGEFSEPATPLTAIWLIYLLIYLAHWPWFLWLSWHFF